MKPSRKLFVGIAASTVLIPGALLITSSPASAQVTQLKVGVPTLGPLGATLSVRLTFTCDTALNVAFGDVIVSQVSGHKLAQGVGTFVNAFPGVPCTGRSEGMTLKVVPVGSFAFKQGRAIEGADLTVFDPVAGTLATRSVSGQAVRIAK